MRLKILQNIIELKNTPDLAKYIPEDKLVIGTEVILPETPLSKTKAYLNNKKEVISDVGFFAEALIQQLRGNVDFIIDKSDEETIQFLMRAISIEKATTLLNKNIEGGEGETISRISLKKEVVEHFLGYEDLWKKPKENIKINFIPLDRQMSKQYKQIFDTKKKKGFKAKTKTDSEGREVLSLTKKVVGGQLTLDYFKDIIVKELGEEEVNKLPVLAGRAERLWLSMIYFAKQQGKGLAGDFTASELLRLWKLKPEKQGRFFEDIRQSFFNIVAVNPSFTNEKTGEERLEWGFSFVGSYVVRGEGRETRYSYNLNQEALGITFKWLEGNLTDEEIKKIGGYIPYPVESLSFAENKGVGEYERNFKEWLLTLPEGRSYETKAYTILKDKCLFRDDLLRRPKECYKRLRGYLERAKESGYLTSYDFKIRDLKNWKKNWTVTVYKSKREKSEKAKQVKLDFKNTKDETELIEKIFKWQTEEIHGITTPKDELKKQIENTVKTYGVDKIKKALARSNTTYDFWQTEVKALKADRTRETGQNSHTKQHTDFKRLFD